MLGKFQEHINTNFSFLKAKKVLVAISGGVDSVVLTDLLFKSKLDIELAHCNFRLRGKDSDDDERFVKDLALKLGVECHSIQFDTEEFARRNKLSIQMAARQLRYNWFQELLKENNLDYITTAHHLDDSLETFILNFSRGTGLDGFIGIPEKNNKIIRPLINFSKEQIEVYAKENKLDWREDISNNETKYTRNKIRHQIIPLLKELNPSLLESYKETKEHLKQSLHIVNDAVAKVKKEVISNEEKDLVKLDIKGIKSLSDPKAYLYQLLKEYGFSEWNDVVNLLDAQSGKQVFSETYRLLKDRDHLLLKRIANNNRNEFFLIHKGETRIVDSTFFIEFKDANMNNLNSGDKNTILVDKDKLTFPLELRKWREADYFYPLGMNGKKKLSKFFKDEKFSLLDKENTWLLCSNNNIVWVVNERLDNRFKITDNTKNALQIEFKERKEL